MNRKELEELSVKKENKTEVIAIRIPSRVKAALESKGLNVAETVRNILLRLADK